MTSFFRKKGGAKLGQYLLTSVDIARAVVEAGSVQEKDTVLEIGPGKGMLTRELLNAKARVIAVEKDPSMVSVLKENFVEEIEKGQLVIHEEDARTFLTSQDMPADYRVVANIPYYITGELIRLFLTAPTQPRSIALLVQKEVAERIARTNKESLLSLSVKAYGTPRYVKTVKAGSFNPPPKVDSAILAIDAISRDNFKDLSEEIFFTVLHAGFGQKRKTLQGNLKRAFGLGKQALDLLWEDAGLSAKVRAEDVPLRTWLHVATTIGSIREN